MASADAEGEYQPAQYPKEGGLLEVRLRFALTAQQIASARELEQLTQILLLYAG